MTRCIIAYSGIAGGERGAAGHVFVNLFLGDSVYNARLTGSPQADQSFPLLCPGVEP
jgi:hypothetical protein